MFDVLKQLPSTKNDFGKPREINKVNTAELKNFVLEPYHVLTDQGQFHFRDLNLERNPFLLKIGEIKLTPDITNKDSAKLLLIFEHLELNPDQIARQPNEINENTKAYVGKLEPGIFDKIQQYDIENIYTSFPEGRVRIIKDFEAGPITFEEFERKREQYNKNITDESMKINISDDSIDMMRNKNFSTLKKREKMSLARFKVSDMGFEKGATTDEIFKRAEQLGLELCPPEVGPQMLLSNIDQPLDEWTRIGMKSISEHLGYQLVFFLTHESDGLWLDNNWVEGSWLPEDAFVFRLRKLKN